MKIITRSLFVLLFITLFSTIGCGGTEQKSSKSTSVTVKANKTTNSTSSNTSASKKIKFKTSTGSELLIVKYYSDHNKIEYLLNGAKKILKSKVSKSGKTKYKSEDKKLVYIVKPKSGSFKLLDASEKLLWKIKTKAGKIKISNNNEGNSPVIIKFKNSEKAKVYDISQTQIGKVKFYSDKGKVKVKNSSGNELFSCKSSKLYPSAGVLLFSQIPLDQQAVIITKLINLGY